MSLKFSLSFFLSFSLSLFLSIFLSTQDEFERYGIDWDGPLPEDATLDEAIVEVPETGCPLSPEQYQELLSSIDPLRESESYGIDIYMETVTFVNTHVVNAS